MTATILICGECGDEINLKSDGCYRFDDAVYCSDCWVRGIILITSDK